MRFGFWMPNDNTSDGDGDGGGKCVGAWQKKRERDEDEVAGEWEIKPRLWNNTVENIMNCMCKYSKGNEIIQKNKSETQVSALSEPAQ